MLVALGLDLPHIFAFSPRRWIEHLTIRIMAGYSSFRRISDWAWGTTTNRSITRRSRKFEYGDRLDQHHIRLLKLPEEGAARLFTLETFVLDQTPTYIALSYTSEKHQDEPYDDTPMHREDYPLIINSRSFEESRISLHQLRLIYHILDHLATARPGAYTWIDAICINSSNQDEDADDLIEKAAQVSIMSTIFQNAIETVVWLGEENVHTESALHSIRQIAHGADAKIIAHAKSGTLGDLFVADDPDLLAKNHLPPLTKDDWIRLHDLFSRPYFLRLWTIQEVALSKAPTCLVGSHSIPWDSIGYAALLLGASNALIGLHTMTNDLTTKDLVGGIMAVINVQTLREWCRGGDSPLQEIYTSTDFAAGVTKSSPEAGLLKLLLATHGYKAQLSRDRVYGLLGLLAHLSSINDLVPLNLPIDYTAENEEILTSLTLRILHATESLHMLSLAGTSSSSIKMNASKPDTAARTPDDDIHTPIFNLPSWIPSFTNHPSPILGPTSHNTKSFNLPNESKDEPLFYIDETNLRLHVQIMTPNLGTIEEVGETWEEMTAGNFQDCIRLLLHCGDTYTPTNQPIIEAFWRTLITDNDLSQRPAPSSLANAFQNWMFLLTLKALQSTRDKHPDLFDLFDNLEPLFILANTRDTTSLLPKSAFMLEKAAEFGVFSDPARPMLSKFARERILKEKARAAASFEGLLKLTLPGARRLARTVRGYLCLVPIAAEVGDKVVVIRGCPTPMVVRRAKEELDCFKVVGDVYVHGAMFREHVTKDSVWRNIILA